MKDMDKQEFQIGETVYLLNSDMTLFEEMIQHISLISDGKTIVYRTTDGFEFTKDNINKTVFKDKESREDYLTLLY